jgi:hypothetical protein
MLRKQSLIAVACSLSLCFAATGSASITFTQGQLLGMTINVADSTFYAAGNGTGILTPAPTYQDGVTPMTGLAGAIGNLNPVGGTATAFYSLSAADLGAFNTAISGGGETLDVVGFNDNNQTWAVGIWYKTAAGIVTDFETIAPGTGGATSLALPTSVLDAGVAVRSVITQPDDYHASWGVPEPTTIAVWAGLIGIGALVGRRLRATVAV